MSAPHYLLLLLPTPRDVDDPHRPLNAIGQDMLDGLPTVLQPAEEFKSLCHVFGREVEFMLARLEHLRQQFWPQTADEMGLPWWEELIGRIADPSLTVEQRRAALLLIMAGQDGSGAEWEATLNRSHGASWTYDEHDPGDTGGVPEYTVRVTVPYAPSSARFAAAQRELREITPANEALDLESSDVFRVDIDHLDTDALTY